MNKKKIVIFIRKKRPEANSIEEIFYLLIKYMGSDVEIKELPYSGASPLSIIRNICYARKHRGTINHISGETHYIALGTGVRTLLTIHDVQSIIKGGIVVRIIKKWLWFVLPILIVRRISVISSFTKNELVTLFPFAKKKVSIVHNSINDVEIVSSKGLIENRSAKKTILHVGTKTNKNLEGVIKAIEELPVRLIVIGAMTKEQKMLAESAGVEYENYYNLPYCSVIELYKSADMVTFPSFYEGFGMPILEANLTCVPILTSDMEVLHEVAGDAAYFINPNSIEEIKNGICELLNNKRLREKLIANGRENIKRFSPTTIAKQYRLIYDQL